MVNDLILPGSLNWSGRREKQGRLQFSNASQYQWDIWEKSNSIFLQIHWDKKNYINNVYTE